MATPYLNGWMHSSVCKQERFEAGTSPSQCRLPRKPAQVQLSKDHLLRTVAYRCRYLPRLHLRTALLDLSTPMTLKYYLWCLPAVRAWARTPILG
jgi:hypothetical protein